MVEKAGGGDAYNGDRIGQGRKSAADCLDDHPGVKEEIEGRIRQQLMPGPNDGNENVETLDADNSVLGEGPAAPL